MKNYKGKTLITTDGTTLLGADDKAGVAEIMTMAAWFLSHPEEKLAGSALPLRRTKRWEEVLISSM